MKKIFLRILKVLAIGVVVIIGFFALGIYLLGKGMCGTFGVADFKSPSGDKIVSRSVMGCGATTADETTLVLKGLRDKVIMVIHDNHEDDLSARWLDENTVVINYSGKPESIEQYVKEISGVKFIYKNGNQDLKVNCLYEECQKIDREKALIQRKEWCNYSKENRKDCDSPEKKGWETCEDGSWCHYDDGGCDGSPEAIKRCADASAEANRPLVTAEQQIQFMKEKTADIATYDDHILQLTFLMEAEKYLNEADPYFAYKTAAFLNELEKRKAMNKETEDMRIDLLDKYGPCWGIPVGNCKE